jgi:hypothetical protein
MKIIITVSPEGNISVEGPLQNKIVMFGILEAAKDAVKNYDPTKVQLIQPVGPVANG